jgi:hypothetical protein
LSESVTQEQVEEAKDGYLVASHQVVTLGKKVTKLKDDLLAGEGDEERREQLVDLQE